MGLNELSVREEKGILFDTAELKKPIGLQELGLPALKLDDAVTFRSITHLPGLGLFLYGHGQKLLGFNDEVLCGAVARLQGQTKTVDSINFVELETEQQISAVAHSSNEKWILLAHANGTLWRAETTARPTTFRQLQTKVSTEHLEIDVEGAVWALSAEGLMRIEENQSQVKTSNVLDFCLTAGSSEAVALKSNALYFIGIKTEETLLPEELQGQKLQLIFSGQGMVVLVAEHSSHVNLLVLQRKPVIWHRRQELFFFEESVGVGRGQGLHIPELSLLILHFTLWSSIRLIALNPLEFIEIDESYLPAVENVGNAEGQVRALGLVRTWLEAPSDAMKKQNTQGTNYAAQPMLCFFGNNSQLMFRPFKAAPEDLPRRKELNALLEKTTKLCPRTELAWEKKAPSPPKIPSLFRNENQKLGNIFGIANEKKPTVETNNFDLLKPMFLKPNAPEKEIPTSEKPLPKFPFPAVENLKPTYAVSKIEEKTPFTSNLFNSTKPILAASTIETESAPILCQFQPSKDDTVSLFPPAKSNLTVALFPMASKPEEKLVVTAPLEKKSLEGLSSHLQQLNVSEAPVQKAASLFSPNPIVVPLDLFPSVTSKGKEAVKNPFSVETPRETTSPRNLFSTTSLNPVAPSGFFNAKPAETQVVALSSRPALRDEFWSSQLRRSTLVVEPLIGSRTVLPDLDRHSDPSAELASAGEKARLARMVGEGCEAAEASINPLLSGLSATIERVQQNFFAASAAATQSLARLLRLWKLEAGEGAQRNVRQSSNKPQPRVTSSFLNKSVFAASLRKLHPAVPAAVPVAEAFPRPETLSPDLVTCCPIPRTVPSATPSSMLLRELTDYVEQLLVLKERLVLRNEKSSVQPVQHFLLDLSRIEDSSVDHSVPCITRGEQLVAQFRRGGARPLHITFREEKTRKRIENKAKEEVVPAVRNLPVKAESQLFSAVPDVLSTKKTSLFQNSFGFGATAFAPEKDRGEQKQSVTEVAPPQPTASLFSLASTLKLSEARVATVAPTVPAAAPNLFFSSGQKGEETPPAPSFKLSETVEGDGAHSPTESGLLRQPLSFESPSAVHASANASKVALPARKISTEGREEKELIGAKDTKSFRLNSPASKTEAQISASTILAMNPSFKLDPEAAKHASPNMGSIHNFNNDSLRASTDLPPTSQLDTYNLLELNPKVQEVGASFMGSIPNISPVSSIQTAAFKVQLSEERAAEAEKPVALLESSVPDACLSAQMYSGFTFKGDAEQSCGPTPPSLFSALKPSAPFSHFSAASASEAKTQQPVFGQATFVGKQASSKQLQVSGFSSVGPSNFLNAPSSGGKPFFATQ